MPAPKWAYLIGPINGRSRGAAAPEGRRAVFRATSGFGRTAASSLGYVDRRAGRRIGRRSVRLASRTGLQSVR